VAFAAESAPTTSPRRSSNQRLATTAESTREVMQFLLRIWYAV
jgi:hypothetical protein